MPSGSLVEAPKWKFARRCASAASSRSRLSVATASSSERQLIVLPISSRSESSLFSAVGCSAFQGTTWGLKKEFFQQKRRAVITNPLSALPKTVES